MRLTIVILVCQLGVSLSAKNNKLRLNFRHENHNIVFPISIQVYDPQGLRVSIPDVQGLETFSFHGRINRAFLSSTQSGESLAEDVTKSSNGHWVYENKNVQLQPGDTLNFWIFLQYKGAGQRFNDLRYKVDTNNLVPIATASQYPERPSYQPADYKPTIITPSTRPVIQNTDTSDTQPSFFDSRPFTNINNRGSQGCVCDENTLKEIWAQMNVTAEKLRTLEETVKPLEEKVASLTETIDELITHLNIGTKLLLTGNLPVRTNPVEDVRHLLIEKLNLQDLSSRILQAEYKPDGISFEVESSVDKLRILKRSKAILSRLTYKIVDPESTDLDVRSED